MYQEHTPSIGKVHAANPCGGQGLPVAATASSDPVVTLRRLEWTGPQAFKARYGARPGIDRDFGTRWGPRHDQRVSHRRAALDSPTGLLYAYDPTWDQYAILAADVPAAVVEAVIKKALASDVHMSAEVFAGLLADHLAAPTPGMQTTTEFVAGAEL